MNRLQTFGALDLRAADGTSLQAVLRQTKRLALLSYMAVEKPGQFHRRDHLLGLFWPESDLKGGRASLSQAIHYLRHHLGKDAIVNRGDEEIGVSRSHLACDAALFQEHVAAGRFREAMELYAGPLLAGLFVDEAEGFEQWLEQKRDTLQRDAMRACAALADEAEARDDHGDVAHWLRRAIQSFPYDENLHRRHISALDRGGDRAAALRAYEELEEKLRADFDSEPSAETKELIRTVRARSDAQMLPPVPRAERRQDVPGSQKRGEDDAPRLRRPRRRYQAVAASVVLLLIAGMSWGAWTARSPETRAAPVNRIAVLYFNDGSPAHDLGYLVDGLTTTLIEHLGQVRQIEVISQNGVRPFRGDSIPLDSVARQLDVGTIVGGTISRSGDQLRVNVEIVKGASGIVVRTKTFTRPVGELFALLDDVSTEVGSFLRNSVGDEIKLQRYKSETNDVAAWQAVQKAQALIADGQLLSEAGNARGALAVFDQAEVLLDRACELDKGWAEPHVLASRLHVLRAWRSLMSGDAKSIAANLDAALAEADEAVELNSMSAPAYEARGRVKFTRWMMLPLPTPQLTALQNSSEKDLLNAVTLDSENARAESALSLLYETQGRFEDARQAARRALDADAYLEDAENILVRLFQASFEVGDDEQAGHWCDEVRQRLTGRWPAAHCDLLLLGWRTDAPVDPRKALYILETFGSAEGAELRASIRPRMAMLAAAVVGRAGDTARAESLVAEAKAAAPHDLELLLFEAAMRARLNQHAQARMLVSDYINKNPKARLRVENGRLFRPIRIQTAARR